jgi:hypothetical protein
MEETMTQGESRDTKIESSKFEFWLRTEEARTAKLEAEADMVGETVATEQANRRLRNGIAVAALVVMALQVLAANGIFAWYGAAGGWDVPAMAITAWMGTTVVEVVSVVLVIVNYLFPGDRGKYA